MKTLFLLLFYFISLTLEGQAWEKARNNHQAFIGKIINGEDWESILSTTDTSLLRRYSSDIEQTILFLKSPMLNAVDSFFHDICEKTYSEFPYRVSGHLRGELYSLHEEDTSFLGRLGGSVGTDLLPKASLLIRKPSNHIIPLLIGYLENRAATRLVVRPLEWDEPAFYLCVSDMAVELLEIISWCDFYDNASHSSLFSDIPEEEQMSIRADIDHWARETIGLSPNEAVVYFLDSICDLGHSFTYTCHNLLFHRDTTNAKKYYQYYYEKLNMPCRMEHDIGKILLTLGDNRVLEDCYHKIINYKCLAETGNKCVHLLLDSHFAYVDDILGEVVSTEPHSLYRNKKFGPSLTWPTIFGRLGNYEKMKMPVTLLALMNIKDDFSLLSSMNKLLWERKYGDQIKADYRVCDLALLKYHDTIKPVDLKDWTDKNERDIAIRTIQEEEKKMRQRY